MDDKQYCKKLISLVQSHPELWDLSNKHYSDLKTKEFSWRDIALELELPVEDVKKKWDCLRSGCRQYLRRKESGGRCFKWPYAKELFFLEKQIIKVRQRRAARYEKKIPKSDMYKKDKKLISCVKQWPMLWDRNHEDHGAVEKRQIVWQTIAEELGAKAEEIKLRWQQLRCNYVRALESSKKHPLQRDMAFLKEQVRRGRRRFVSNNESVDESRFSIYGDAESISSEVEIKVESDVEEEQAEPNFYEKPDVVFDEPDLVEVDISKLKNGVNSYTEASNQVECVYPKFKSYHNTCVGGRDGAEGLKQFFLSLAETVNTLPPLLQAKVKAEVFKTVNSAELAFLEAGQC